MERGYISVGYIESVYESFYSKSLLGVILIPNAIYTLNRQTLTIF